ncbi:MAG: alpha/beta fold hydrolase [Cyclobacteriaceae bacterium]|nr:alpha/beta fold hydrolase [Cyclobacteriaceae bacterium]
MKNLILICSLLFSIQIFAQTEQQLIHIGDFFTTEGKIIKDCKVGFRTVGKQNADKSNVVLWPTWFGGSSADIISGSLTNLIDTTGLYIIVVDALTNGISSSPSNTPNFPIISIRDMVNSQHILLTKHLDIHHLKAVIGISMGGMQAFEWMVAYPRFMEKIIPIVGSPKQSFYDKLVWQTMADLINNNQSDQEFSYHKAHSILLMNLYTPSYMASHFHPDSLNNFLSNSFQGLIHPEDYLGGLYAMIHHDIYKSTNINPEKIKKIIQAKVLIIVGLQDHLVNPISSIHLAELSGIQVLRLESDCGHMVPSCESEKIRTAIDSFMN